MLQPLKTIKCAFKFSTPPVLKFLHALPAPQQRGHPLPRFGKIWRPTLSSNSAWWRQRWGQVGDIFPFSRKASPPPPPPARPRSSTPFIGEKKISHLCTDYEIIRSRDTGLPFKSHLSRNSRGFAHGLHRAGSEWPHKIVRVNFAHVASSVGEISPQRGPQSGTPVRDIAPQSWTFLPSSSSGKSWRHHWIILIVIQLSLGMIAIFLYPVKELKVKKTKPNFSF